MQHPSLPTDVVTKQAMMEMLLKQHEDIVARSAQAAGGGTAAAAPATRRFLRRELSRRGGCGKSTDTTLACHLTWTCPVVHDEDASGREAAFATFLADN